jgi:YD repeat-containing protein
MFRRARTVAILAAVAITAIAGRAQAQTTYHLHNEPSGSRKLLQTANPDVASVAIQTANLHGTGTGEKLIKEFDTQAGVPNLGGVIPSGSTVTFRIWIKRTGSGGTLRPLLKLFLNNSSGTLLCSATSTTAIGTSFGANPTTLMCNTSANVTLVSTSRFYAWIGANMTADSSTSFVAEVDIEGTASGNFDSRIDIPNVRPAITSFSPTSAGVGQSVTINGTNFGGSGTVKFGTVTASPTSWSATSIATPVPPGTPTGTVSVTVASGGQTSLGANFTVKPTPTITSLSTTSGGPGVQVTINGTNFKPTGAVTVVTFSGVATMTFSTWTSTKIITTVPAGTPIGAGSLIVTVNDVPSAPTTFTVLGPPVIDTLTPSQGGVGQSMVITGSNFGGSGTVMFSGFGGTPAGINSWSGTSINAAVPFQDLGPATVTVIVGSQTSNPVTFTMLPTPSITSVSPSPAPVGATVTMNGTNLGATQGSSTLTFNGTPATTFPSWSNTQIQAVVPAGASTGNIVAIVNGVPSNSATSLLVRPTLTSLSASSAHINDVITITGQSFGTTQGFGEKVRFNGIEATPTGWSDTSITTPVPIGATSGNVVVQVFNGANLSNPLPFTVIPPPTVTSATPPAARVGDPVAVGGTNFGTGQGTNTITFNGIAATPSAWSDTQITALVPAGAVTGNIVVTVSGAASPGFAFTVIQPGTMSGTVTRVTGGSAIGGANVQALNAGVVKGSATTAANGTYTIPSLDPGSYDVRVFASGLSSELTTGHTIVSSSTTTVNVAMYAPGSVGGRVTQADGVTPIAGAAVTVYSGSAQKGTANTNGTGDYAIGGLHPGSFTVQAANVGYTTKEQGAAVTESATTTSNFALQGAPTGPVLYAYDELNRLVQVTDPAGESAIYRYDAVGNIVAIERPGAAGVAIASFTPYTGPIGTFVTISGTGFSTTPAQNTVTFGGTSATVTSATATQLVTTVPASLAPNSYTVGVTTPGGSATGSAFVVTTGGAPTISGFTPGTAAAGTALTVNGTNFDTQPTNDNLRLNLGFTQVTAATATALQTTVPSAATTGKIRLATPNGAVDSAAYLWIAPVPYVVSDVDSTGILAVGTPTPVSVPTANKIALRAFEGVEGHRASIAVTGVTGGSVSGFLYGPFGTVAQATLSILVDGFVETTALPLTGTYTIVFDPQTANATTATLTVYDVPPDIAGPLSFETPTGVTVTVPGQNGRLTFAGIAGHRVSLDQTNFNCFTAATSILDPTGLAIAATCGGSFIDTTTLGSTGTYTVVFNPSSTVTGTTTLTLHDVPPDVTGTIAFNTPTVMTTTVAGQNARYTFTGAAGQRVALNQSNYNCFTAHTAILKPDGTELAGGCGGAFIDATVLPAAGTYTVLVDPVAATVGSNTVTLYDVPADASGSTTVNGAAVPLTMTTIGQNGQVSFTGAAGQQVTVHISGNTVGGLVNVRLLSTDGTTVLTQTSSLNSNFDLSLQTLPAAGTYIVVVDPPGLSTGGATVSITSP